MTSRQSSYGALLAATTIWGFNLIPLKLVLNVVTPVIAAFMVIIVATCILWLINGKTILQTPNLKRNLKNIIFTGLLGPFGFNLFLHLGLLHSSVINTSLLLSLTPIIGLLAAIFFTSEGISLPIMVGAVLSVLGAGYLVFDGGKITFDNIQLHKGDLLVVGAVLSFVSYMIFVKKMLNTLPFNVIMVGSYSIATVCFTMITFVFCRKEVMNLVDIRIFSFWAAIFYLGAVKEVLAVFLHTYGLKKADVSIAASFTNLMPIVSIIFSILLIGEKLTITHVVSGFLILVGVGLAVYCNKNKETSQMTINLADS